MGKLIRMSWRNVWRNGRRTSIALIAIALGLTLLVFFDGFINGAKQSIYGNAVKMQGGNIAIHAPGYGEKTSKTPLLPLNNAEEIVQAVAGQPNVVAVSQRINTGGLVSSREGTFPVAITGIEPEREAPVSLVAENIVAGRFLNAADEDMVLIGKALAEQLEVGVDDRITLVGRATHEQMRQRTMTVVGIYSLGLSEVEKGLVYISLLEAQALYDLTGQATEVVVALERVGQEPEVVARLEAILPGFEIDSWEETNPELKNSVQANEIFMDIFSLIILGIAGIGILNLLLMAVYERTREIGLLAAMGLKQRGIMGLFLFEGVWMGVLGALAGGLLGALVTYVVGIYGIDYSGMAEISEMTALMGERAYPILSFGIIFERSVTIAIIAALAALYPAWQASHKEPAEALHFV